MKGLLEREVEILASVRDQRRCVQFIEHYFESHVSYLVMERCETSMLGLFDRLPKVCEPAIARTLTEILQGLVGIHTMGIAHRDIKPDNLLFHGTPRSGVIKLCDF